MKTRYRYASTTGGRHVHRVIAEKALGRKLAGSSPVHHVNGDGLDPSRGNLVICQDTAYHKLLHIRQRALDACGNANWRKCIRCKRYDDTANLSIAEKNKSGEPYHRACASKAMAARYKPKRTTPPRSSEERRAYLRDYYRRNRTALLAAARGRKSAAVAELQKVERSGA